MTCIAALLLLAQSGSCSLLWWGGKADSRWLDKPFEVTGNEDAWSRRDLDDEQGLSFAFFNDDKDLYLFVRPHTTWTKDQMMGVYHQDLTIWLDGAAGTKKAVAVRLKAPPHEGSLNRELELVGVDGKVVSQPDAIVGPIDMHGGLEARIPLVYFGGRLPEKISVGIVASKPDKPPVPKERPRARTQDQAPSEPSAMENTPLDQVARAAAQKTSRPPPVEETYEPIELWVKVKLAKASEH